MFFIQQVVNQIENNGLTFSCLIVSNRCVQFLSNGGGLVCVYVFHPLASYLVFNILFFVIMSKYIALN